MNHPVSKLVRQKNRIMHLSNFIKKLLFNISIGCIISYTSVAQSSFERLLEDLYKNTVPLIKPQELSDLIKSQENLILLDTRSRKEYRVSHLTNSVLVDYDSFDSDKINHLEKDAKIIVYCAVGYRSERVGEKLLDLGFKDVQNLYGGIFQWKNNDQPVVDTKGMVTDSVHTYNKAWSRWLKKGIKVYE